MNKLLPFVSFAFLLALSFSSCEKDPTTSNNSNNNNNNNGANQVLTTITISDATSLVITNNSSSGANNLLKTTLANGIEEVLYLDAVGDTLVNPPDPSYVYDLNSQYLIITLEYETKAYLVRKTDGKVYDFTSVGVPYFIINDGQWGGPRNRPRIQMDGSGLVYYISGYDAPIVKADFSNPAMITGGVHTYVDDNVRNFIVTPNGDVAYESWGAVAGVRIKKANGGIHTLSQDNFWVDLSGNITHAPDVYWDTQTQSNKYDVIKLTINPTSGAVTEDTTSINTQIRTDYGTTYEFRFADKVVMVSTDALSDDVIEVDNVSSQITSANYTIVGNLEYGDASNDYIYLLTQNGGDKTLTKIHKDSYNSQVLATTNGSGYDIYKYAVNDAEMVTFYALRTSDGARVLGEIDAAGGLNVLSSNVNAVAQLERLD